MSSTNKTTHYELSQYIGTDKPTYLGDYNSDMLAIDTAIHNAADAASTAVSTANSAASSASAASTAASTATTTANTAKDTADSAAATAATANTNAAAALTAAQGAQTAAAANTITNLAPAYDAVAGTYAVGDLVTFIDDQGSGKLYKNIVAIESPHAFNINEWDDVTTSEVYNRKSKILASVTADGVKTISQIYDELFAAYTYNENSEYLLHNISATAHGIKHMTSASENDIYFASTNMDLTIGYISKAILLASGSKEYNLELKVSDNSITAVDASNTFIPANGRIFMLTELTTI